MKKEQMFNQPATPSTGNTLEQAKNSAPENTRHPDYDLIAEKLLISRATTTEQFGSPNVAKAAEHLYASLYEPEEIDQLIMPNEKFPNRMAILKTPLTSSVTNKPSKEEFIAKVRHIMTHEVDFGQCLSLESRQAFLDIMRKSEQTVIWTNGDSKGIPEYNLPGSKEQLSKLAAAQFYNKARREIAHERGIDHKEVLSVVAIEGKMNFIQDIVKKFKDKGVERIFIIEDQMKNLIKAIDLIKKTRENMDIFPVWIRQGQFKNKIEPGKTLEEWTKDLHAINDISELLPVLEKNNIFDKKVGSIFDLDGPLHDDEIRKKIQTKAVIEALQEKGWI